MGSALATNPLILDQFTADPTARVFEGRVYVYPSHDIIARPGQGRPGWFCMEDYHVYSSDNLTDWTDHGVIVSQTTVDWANPTAYSMWAPDCVSRNGKYYFYFPAIAKTGGFRIGVAVGDRPEGPFQPEAEPIAGVRGIDPCVFIDEDGTAYLYYAMRRIFVAKLKANMLELDGAPGPIDHLPTKGLMEGPFVFARKGIYYLTYPHVENRIERLEYAIGEHPLGPFQPAGVILDEAPSGCWTVHQSMIEYQGQWYLFYHDKDLSPDFDKARSVRADRMFFNDDGTIRKVARTLRGIGVVKARDQVQVDRYSAISREGASVSFLDPGNPAGGWKISLNGKSSWVRFNRVDFAQGDLKTVEVRAASARGGAIEIRRDDENGPVLGRVEIAAGSGWKVIHSGVENIPTGVHDLVITQKGSDQVDLDWIRFGRSGYGSERLEKTPNAFPGEDETAELLVTGQQRRDPLHPLPSGAGPIRQEFNLLHFEFRKLGKQLREPEAGEATTRTNHGMVERDRPHGRRAVFQVATE